MTDEAKALGRAAAAIWVWVPIGEGRVEYVNACGKAADRIEHLEQALREIIDFGDGDTGYGNSCAKIARAALAGDSHDQ